MADPATSSTSVSAVARAWQFYKSISPWTAMAAYITFFVAWGICFLPEPGDRALIAIVAIPTGLLLDYVLHKLQTGRPNWQSALITSGIVALLMPPDVDLVIVWLAIAVAIGSKHFLLLRSGGSDRPHHVFNPAGFGVAVTAALFAYPLGWWPDSFLWLVLAFGLLNVWRVRKFTQVVAYAVVYVALVSATAGFPSGSLVFSGFGTQTLPLALPYFFMLFMLPEPVTSLQHRWGQIQFGALAAVVAVATSYVPVLAGAAVVWGLLAANVFAFVSRSRHRAA